MTSSLSRADDQTELQVVDVLRPPIAVPDVRGLKRHVLLEWQRRAGGESIPVPPAIAPLVKRFVIGERFPDVAIDREGMGDSDSMAIAVDFIDRPEPPDIHVAVGDFESADRELDCPVDAKLVLLERVGEPRGKAHALVETAWR